MIGSCNGLEYNVVYRLANAADYGVPQIRHRVVIVGFRNDLNASWSFPEPTHSKEELLKAKYGDGSYWEEHKIPKNSLPEVPVIIKHSLLQMEMPFVKKERWQAVRDEITGLSDSLSESASSFPNHEYRVGARPYPGLAAYLTSLQR